jgi:tetratricopeptide (TPR) repeat protein
MADDIVINQSTATLTTDILELLGKGVSYGEFIGLEDKHKEAIYKIACIRYENDRYVEALKLFSLGSIQFQYEERFYFGSGSCAKMLKDYDLAIKNFIVVKMLDPENIVAECEVAECLFLQGKTEEAKLMLMKIKNENNENKNNKKILLKVNSYLNLFNKETSKKDVKIEE